MKGMHRLDALAKEVGELAGPLGASTGTTVAGRFAHVVVERRCRRLTRASDHDHAERCLLAYLLAIILWCHCWRRVF